MRTSLPSIIANTCSRSLHDALPICSTSEVAVCSSLAWASSRLQALNCCSRSTPGWLSLRERIFAFVPYGGSLLPWVRVFAPLRDKVISSVQDMPLAGLQRPGEQTCQRRKNSTQAQACVSPFIAGQKDRTPAET